MIPNVLTAHALDIEKLNAFTGLYNELMLSDSGLSKLGREMIAVVVLVYQSMFLLSYRPWGSGKTAVWGSHPGRAVSDEL